MGLLDDKVAFITGAGRGQGRSHAVRLAEEGADIVAVDVCADVAPVPYPMATDADLAETEKLVRDLGRGIVTVRADVREYRQLKDAVAAGLDAFGHLDIVLANAGVAPTVIAIDDEDAVEAGWDTAIAVNLKGVWNTVRACIPPMIERGAGGAIVLTSSTAGLKGLGAPKVVGNEGYGASKWGVVGLMRNFAMELAPYSIRVNTVHPTGVDTAMINNPAMESFLASFPDAVSSLTNMLPVELLQPRDISDAVLFLVSDHARYITGVTLPVDAGFTAK
jgi:SDR family mycofactocin-dependent oxidoreductase